MKRLCLRRSIASSILRKQQASSNRISPVSCLPSTQSMRNWNSIQTVIYGDRWATSNWTCFKWLVSLALRIYAFRFNSSEKKMSNRLEECFASNLRLRKKREKGNSLGMKSKDCERFIFQFFRFFHSLHDVFIRCHFLYFFFMFFQSSFSSSSLNSMPLMLRHRLLSRKKNSIANKASKKGMNKHGSGERTEKTRTNENKTCEKIKSESCLMHMSIASVFSALRLSSFSFSASWMANVTPSHFYTRTKDEEKTWIFLLQMISCFFSFAHFSPLFPSLLNKLNEIALRVRLRKRHQVNRRN